MSVEVFERSGVRFLYPQGWDISEEDWIGEPRTVTLQSPLSGYWSLHVYEDANPQQLVEEVLTAMQDEYDALETQPTRAKIGGHPAAGYDLSFYCLDLLVVARVRAMTVAGATYLMITQAEDRDLEQLGQVFDAIAFSLVQGV